MYASQDPESDISIIASRYTEAHQSSESIFLDASQWTELMEHFMEGMQYTLAVSAADDAGDTYPDNIAVSISRCEVYIYTENTSKAIPIIKDLTSRHSEMAAVRVLYGMYLSSTGEAREAIEYYLSAYEEYEDSYRLNILLGEEYSSIENYGMAIRYFQKSIITDHSDDRVIDMLVEVYIKSESHTLGAHFFKRLIEKDPYNAKLWRLCGFFLYRKGSIQEALQALEYATYIATQWSTPYYDMSEILWEEERYDDIISCLQRLLSYDTIEDPYPYSMLGKCYHQKGEIEKSCEYFLRAIHYDPLNAEGWYNLSLAHFTSGYKRQALEYIYQGLECDSNDVECLRLAWEIEESLHMWDEADTHLSTLIEHPESNDDDYMDYAYFLYERGEYTKALEILKNLRQINENCYEAFYHMSSIYFGIGDYEKGSNMLKKALSLAPELLHVIEDNYPELIDRIPLLKQYFPIGDSGKKN